MKKSNESLREMWPNHRVDRTVAEPRRFVAAGSILRRLRDGVTGLPATVGHSNRWNTSCHDHG